MSTDEITSHSYRLSCDEKALSSSGTKTSES